MSDRLRFTIALISLIVSLGALWDGTVNRWETQYIVGTIEMNYLRANRAH